VSANGLLGTKQNGAVIEQVWSTMEHYGALWSSLEQYEAAMEHLNSRRTRTAELPSM
jgi:hypothetical protein